MDFTPKYPVRSNSEPSSTIYTSTSELEVEFRTHWPNNMYSMQNLESTSKQQLIEESAGENNHNFGIYTTKHSSSVDNMSNQPKKESLWQSVTRSFTNLLGEHLTRGTNSFIKNLNNPLSVTVVSPEIYKSLQKKPHQLVNPTEDFCSAGVWKKESHNSVDMLPNILCDNEIISDSVKRIDSDTSDSDKMWNEYKNMYISTNGTLEKNLIKDEKFVNSVNTGDYKNESSNSHFIIDETDLNRSTNFGNTINVDDEPVILEKPESTFESHKEEDKQSPKVESEQSRAEKPLQESVSKMLSNACNKVVNGVVDLLQLGTTPADTDSISLLFTKRACSSKAPRPKRMHITNGRGRGRAKYQLRRSGVSQARHRKERSRYDKSDEIKSDIDNWEELEYCSSSSSSSSTEDEKFEELDERDAPEEPRQMRSTSFTLADVKPKKRKTTSDKNCGWGQLSVQSLDSELDAAFSTEKTAFRRRLPSESSVDSEDSYCIVFEGGDCGEDEETQFETEDESCSESETESETESDDDEGDDNNKSEKEIKSIPTTKVRFDPNPVVHKMVKWAFAYKAARIGPWEQIGRDLERFRNRIHNTGRILEPVLSQKHRMEVWQERFAD